MIQKCPQFNDIPNEDRLPYLLGEEKGCCILAAQFVFSCHTLRDNV
uniref:Uncharacterized protein n=1 Tax=Anguilla anguilla TaxID=7936 RepID=A0A0E9VMW8_ANGAN